LTLSITILILLLLLQGGISLAGGVQFVRYVRKSLSSPGSSHTPPAAIIAPVKGLDAGIADNIGRLFAQNYPGYEIIFVIAEPRDPARAVIEQAIAVNPGRQARLIIAGSRSGRSQKVNNLLHGVAAADPRSDVLVFVDSDAQVSPDWLSALVDPLGDADVGASTGYRWYLPVTSGFWSELVSAWNGSIATTLGDHGRNFVWGGSAAITRDTFERIRVADNWERALSDDYALTAAVRQAGLRIVFVPRCLLVTREDFGLKSALEFTRRQVTITRVYKPAAWWTGLISHTLFAAGFFGGIGWAMYEALIRPVTPPNSIIPAAATPARLGASTQKMSFLIVALCLIYVLGCIKGWLRLRAAGLLLPQARSELRPSRIMFYMLWPLVSLLFLYDFLASATTRKIKWRGIWYEMRSPTETIVLNHEKK